MSFGFLYPLFWLGAAAVAAPVWLHLRRQRPTKSVAFSALRFLDDQPRPLRSPLRLRDLPLLALRLAGFLLLVAAFAWPYRRRPEPEIAVESRVYILDNTLSHQANDGFARDVRRLRDELAALGPETQAAVVELTAQPRVLAGFGDDHATASGRVAERTPSHQRGSYLAAFRTASTLLAHALGQKKTIVLLADSQENQWTENASAPPFLEGVEVVLPKVPETSAPNVALSRPRVQRVLLGDRALIDLALDLDHAGPARTATLTVLANDREVLRREVELPGDPGTLTLSTQWEADPHAGLAGEAHVSGEPDALEADNRVVFALPPVTEGKVVVLAESPYLRTALAPDVMRGRWSARVVEPAGIAAESDAGPGHDGDVLCVESHYLQASKARDLVLRYLNAGRGVLLLIDRDTPVVHGFLRSLGFEPRGEAAGKTTFRYIFGDHPIFHPFLSPDFGNLMEVSVARHRQIRAAQALPLVFGEGGDALFFQGTTTRGTLLVAPFGFERDETDWPLHPTFLPFLDLCLQTARARDELPTDFEPGELAVLSLPGDRTSGEVVLRQGDRVLLREPIQNSRIQARLPDAPGLYTWVGLDAPGVERPACVNPSARESQLTYLKDPGMTRTWQLDPTRLAVAPTSVPPGEPTRAGILRQRAWWWLLLLGLAAFLGESAWLAARRERS